MLDEIVPLPEDPEELRAFTARLLAEVKAQAILIEKLRHQLAGHRAHRFGSSSETAEQLQLADTAYTGGSRAVTSDHVAPASPEPNTSPVVEPK